MAEKDIGKNLRRYLSLKGYSIATFSMECGIGTATLSNILNDKSSPTSSTLIKITDKLDISFNALLADNPKLKTLRFKIDKELSAREKAQRDQIIVDSTLWLTNYVELEDITNQHNDFIFTNIKSKDPLEAAHEVRSILNLSPDEPIRDIVSLIEKSGIKVYLHPFNFQRTFGLSINKEDGGPAIIVNTDDSLSLERRIFTIACELGHLILHQDSYNGQVELESPQEVKEADIFASELLVPQKALEQKLKEYKGLSWYEVVLQIKKYFFVSYKTILYRLKNMPNATLYTNEAFLKLYNVPYAHTKASPLDTVIEVEPLLNISFIETRYSYLVREAYENEKISITRAAELLNLSINEMRNLISNWL